MDNLLFKSGNAGQVNVDQAQGIVECFVAGIGNKDSVGDIVISGAFAKSLTRRKPRVVWGHSWNDPIGKVLEMYEVPVGDSRLPAKMRNAGIGGLYAKVQFNLNSEKGKEAFATVAFFGEEQEWSIGYKTIDSVFDPNLQANILKEVELYEVSPVLHGANQLTGTISIKADEKGYMPIIPMHGDAAPMMQGMPRIVVVSASKPDNDESSEGDPFAEGMSEELNQPDKMALQAELAERTGSKIEVMNATENSVVFRRTTSDGQSSMYRLPYHREGDQYMFGKPEAYEAEAPKPQPQPQQNIEQKPGSAVVVPNGGIAYRNDDQQEMMSIFGGDVESPWGKSEISHLIEMPEVYMSSARDFLSPVLRHHKLNGRPSAKGIIIDGLLTANALDALQNAVKALGTTIGQAGGNIGQAIGRIRDLAQTFNPYALDGDGDGFVQDGSAFMRPYIPVKKPGFDLPDIRGRKRSGDALLDKPRKAPELPKDKAKWTREQRNEALRAGVIEPETREDVSFLANSRPENEGVAKYWDMSEADLTKEGNRLANARRQATGAEKESIDQELLKVSHEFQRRAAYAETFGQEFTPPAKRESAPAMVPEADKPEAPSAPVAEMSDEDIYNERMSGTSLAEMAERLGISREEVRQREQRHMRELRDREEQRRMDRQADDALDRALEGYIERYGEDAEPPTSDSGLASAGKVFDSLNREQIRNDDLFRDWDDLDDDEKLEMFQEVQYDYLYENYGNLGDDGLVDAMEDPKYDDEIYEHAEEVYNKIKAKRDEERSEKDWEKEWEAERAFIESDLAREAEYEDDRLSSRGRRQANDDGFGIVLPDESNDTEFGVLGENESNDTGFDIGEFGSNPEDSKAAQVFDAVLEKYWKMWGFDVPDKDDKGYDEPFGLMSRGSDEEVKQNKLDELVGNVRDRLIAELETADPATWKPSWRNDALPINPITGKPYRGWNAFWLMFATHDRKYKTGRFAGIKQLNERGARVRKGEKGVPILRPQLVKKEDADGNVKEFLVFRGATVFNVDQTDGGDESLRAIPADLPESERIKILDDTLAELGVNVRTQNMTPHYDPDADYISMPEFSKGTSALEWSSTLAHETMHWTGHKSRLNRIDMTNFGREQRAREELVAEIASAMFLAAHGIEAPFREDHAPYIKGWIQLLKDDPEALEKAFKDAQAALNFALEKSPNLRRLFGGLDNGKKSPDVDAPTKVGVAAEASEGLSSLYRVRTPGSQALAGILYDDNSGELMVGFLKGKSWDDLSEDEKISWIDRVNARRAEVGGYKRPLSDSEIDDLAREAYEDARDVGWYVYQGVTMDEVDELSAARSKGRHINALKKLKKARKASDEDQFNFFGRTERVQDVSRAKSTDGLASRGDALRPGVLESIQNNRNLRQVVGNDSRDVAALYMGYLNWHRETEDNDGDTGGFLGSPDSVNAFIELIRDGESVPYVPFENMYDANSVRIANELANEIDRYNDFVKREYAFSPKRIEGLASRGDKRIGIEPNFQDKEWVNRTQERILRQGLDFQSLSEKDQIDWVNSFLDEYLRENEMGHGLSDLANGRRMTTRPDIELFNYAETAYARMSDAHARKRASFGEETEGLSSVGSRTRRLGTKPSDAVDYVAWDPDTDSLYVSYKRGDGRSQMYVYEGVNSDEALAVENADSLGRAINAIKRAKNVRQATPEEVIGLADTDKRADDASRKRLARSVLSEVGNALDGMEIDFISDTEMNVSDGSEKTLRVSIDPDTLEMTVSKIRTLRGGREEPDDEELYGSESAQSAGDVRVLASLFMDELQRDLDDDARIEREIDDARRELDEAGDAPGVESIDVTYSSALDAVDYNPNTQELRVSYKDGGTYVYEGVDRATVQDLKSAPSKGRAMNEIKRAHPYRKDSEWTGGADESTGIEEFDVRGSAAVERVTYDPSKEELTVVYGGGRGYVYSGVTREEADAVRSAPSKGRAINDIKRTHDVRKAEDVVKSEATPAGWTKEGTNRWTSGDWLITADSATGKFTASDGMGNSVYGDDMETMVSALDGATALRTGIFGRPRPGTEVVRDPAPVPSASRAKTQRPPRGGKRVRNRNVVIEMEQGTLDEIMEAEEKGTTVDALRAARGASTFTKGPRKGKRRGPDTITVRDAETGELLHSNEILMTSSAQPGNPSAANRKRGYIRARSYAGRQGHNVTKDEGPSLRGEGRGMTEYDKRVYGLGSDEKNREYGLASRGQRLGEIRQMETAQGWIDDAQLREPLEIINLEDERAQERLGETLVRAGIIDSLDDPHFEGMFGFGNTQESNTILVFAPDTDAGVMDAASGNDYRKPKTRYLIPTKDGKWAIVELGGDYDGAPDGPPGYNQNYEIIGEPTTYTSAVRKIQALEKEDVKPRDNRGLASRGDETEFPPLTRETLGAEIDRLIARQQSLDTSDPDQLRQWERLEETIGLQMDRLASLPETAGNDGLASRDTPDYRFERPPGSPWLGNFLWGRLGRLGGDFTREEEEEIEAIDKRKREAFVAANQRIVRGEKSPLVQLSLSDFSGDASGGILHRQRSEQTYDIYGPVSMPIYDNEGVARTLIAEQVVRDWSRSDLTVDEIADRFNMKPMQVQDILEDAAARIRHAEELKANGSRGTWKHTTFNGYLAHFDRHIEIGELVAELFEGDRKPSDIPEPTKAVISGREKRESIRDTWETWSAASRARDAALAKLQKSPEYQKVARGVTKAQAQNDNNANVVRTDNRINDPSKSFDDQDENLRLLQEVLTGDEIIDVLEGTDYAVDLNDRLNQSEITDDYYDDEGNTVSIEDLEFDWFDIDLDELTDEEKQTLSDSVEEYRRRVAEQVGQAKRDLGLPDSATLKDVERARRERNIAENKKLSVMEDKVREDNPVPPRPGNDQKVSANSSLMGAVNDDTNEYVTFGALRERGNDGLASRGADDYWREFPRGDEATYREYLAKLDAEAEAILEDADANEYRDIRRQLVEYGRLFGDGGDSSNDVLKAFQEEYREVVGLTRDEWNEAPRMVDFGDPGDMGLESRGNSGYVSNARGGNTIAPGARPTTAQGKSPTVSPTSAQMADLSELESIIRSAERDGQAVRFNYNGKEREVFPVQVYRNPKTGKTNMVGQDSNGERKTFTLDKMSPTRTSDGLASRSMDPDAFDFEDIGEDEQRDYIGMWAKDNPDLARGMSDDDIADAAKDDWDSNAQYVRRRIAEELLTEISDLLDRDADADNILERNGSLYYAEELIKNTSYVDLPDLAEAADIVDRIKRNMGDDGDGLGSRGGRGPRRDGGGDGLASRMSREDIEQARIDATEFPDEYEADMANMRRQETNNNFARLSPEDQNMYIQRALANNAESGMSSDQILDEARRLAMDDREMAELERQAVSLGESKPRKIDVASSSALNSVEYDEVSKVLSVEFRGRDGKGTGTVYNYENVEPEVVDRLEASDSRGATMRQIRDNYEFSTSRKLPESAYEGLRSLGGRRSTEDMRKELDEILTDPITLVRDNDISGVSDLIEYRENLIRARNRAGREMLGSRPVNRTDVYEGENDYSNVRYPGGVSADFDDQQILEDYDDAISEADEVLDTYRNLMDEQRAKVASVTRAGSEARSLREKIDDYNIDYVEEDFEASRDEHLSMINDVDLFFDDESTGESYGDESVTHDLSHDDFVTREDRDLLERLKTEVQNATTAEDFEQVRDQLSDVMRRLESDFEKRYRDEETKLDYETPFVEDASDLLDDSFNRAINPKVRASGFGKETEGGFFSRGRSGSTGTKKPRAKKPKTYDKYSMTAYGDKDNELISAELEKLPELAEMRRRQKIANREYLENGRSSDESRAAVQEAMKPWLEKRREVIDDLVERGIVNPGSIEDPTQSTDRYGDGEGLASRGRRGRRKAPRMGWSAEDRQNFADRNFVRSRTRPGRRRNGPDRREWDGLESTSVVDDDLAPDVPVDERVVFEGGEHGPGKDISLNQMWRNYNRLFADSPEDRWGSQGIASAEEAAEFFDLRLPNGELDIDLAAKLLRARNADGPELFIDDPYLADKLAISLGFAPGDQSKLFGFDPLAYTDEAGNVARETADVERAIASERSRRTARQAARASRRTGKETMMARGMAVTISDLERSLQKIDPNIKLTNDDGMPLPADRMLRSIRNAGIPLPWSIEPYRQIAKNGGVLTPGQIADLVKAGFIDRTNAPARADLALSEALQWPAFSKFSATKMIEALSDVLGLDRAELEKVRRTIGENLTHGRQGKRKERNVRNIRASSLKLSRKQIAELAERLGLDAEEFETWFNTAPFTKD